MVPTICHDTSTRVRLVAASVLMYLVLALPTACSAPATLPEAEVTALMSSYKQAKELMYQGKHEEAAALFVALASKHPKEAFAPVVMYDAAVCYQEAGLVTEALATYETVVGTEAWASSKVRKKALFTYAMLLEKTFALEEAAQHFAALATEHPGESTAPEAAVEAAIIYEAIGKDEAAADMAWYYGTTFVTRPDAAKIMWSALPLYSRAEAWDDLVAKTTAFVEDYGDAPMATPFVMGAKLLVARRLQAQGKPEARALLEEIVATFEAKEYPPGSPPAAVAAEAAYLLLESDKAALGATTLAGPLETQEATLASLETTVAELTEGYMALYDYKVPTWTLAATYEIGALLRTTATILKSATVPTDLPPESEGVYLPDLVDQGDEYMALAAVKLESLLVNATASHLLADQWTTKALETLDAMAPGSYPIFQPVDAGLDEVPFVASFRASGEDPAAAMAKAEEAMGSSGPTVALVETFAAACVVLDNRPLAAYTLTRLASMSPTPSAKPTAGAHPDAIVALGDLALAMADDDPIDRPSHLARAAQCYEQASALDGTNALARGHLAFVLLELGVYDKAHDVLDEALELSSGGKEVLLLQALLARAEGNHQKAVETMAQLIATHPTWAPPYLDLAVTYLAVDLPLLSPVTRYQSAVTALEGYATAAGSLPASHPFHATMAKAKKLLTAAQEKQALEDELKDGDD